MGSSVCRWSGSFASISVASTGIFTLYTDEEIYSIAQIVYIAYPFYWWSLVLQKLNLDILPQDLTWACTVWISSRSMGSRCIAVIMDRAPSKLSEADITLVLRSPSWFVQSTWTFRS